MLSSNPLETFSHPILCKFFYGFETSIKFCVFYTYIALLKKKFLDYISTFYKH
jgi:hypothetical protein